MVEIDVYAANASVRRSCQRLAIQVFHELTAAVPDPRDRRASPCRAPRVSALQLLRAVAVSSSRDRRSGPRDEQRDDQQQRVDTTRPGAPSGRVGRFRPALNAADISQRLGGRPRSTTAIRPRTGYGRSGAPPHSSVRQRHRPTSASRNGALRNRRCRDATETGPQRYRQPQRRRRVALAGDRRRLDSASNTRPDAEHDRGQADRRRSAVIEPTGRVDPPHQSRDDRGDAGAGQSSDRRKRVNAMRDVDAVEELRPFAGLTPEPPIILSECRRADVSQRGTPCTGFVSRLALLCQTSARP